MKKIFLLTYIKGQNLYQNTLKRSINPINKETSVLKLKINGENPGKSIDFLNKQGKSIEYGLIKNNGR